jgi:quinol monooxygenase YgiN
MLVIRIILHVLPEKRLEFSQTLLSMIEPIGKEDGCISYGVFCDLEASDHFILFGEWESRKALDNHIRSHRFSIILGSRTLLSEPLKIKILTVSDIEGMEVVTQIRNKES